MSRNYLVSVDEIDTEAGTFIFKIAGIGILIAINYYFIKSLIKIDAETLGVLSGLALSSLIALIVWIIKKPIGLVDSLEEYGYPLLIQTGILMILGITIFPIIVELINGSMAFQWIPFLKNLFWNSLLLAACTPLATLIVLLISIPLSYLLSIPIYELIYLKKRSSIKKTKCWEIITNYCIKIDFKNHILKLKIYPDKMEFYDSLNTNIYTFIYSSVGYSNLSPLSELTLINMLKKETKTKLAIEERWQSGYSMGYVLINKDLNKKNKKEMKRIIKKDKKTDKIFKKAKNKQDNLKEKKYKKAKKEGKDW